MYSLCLVVAFLCLLCVRWRRWKRYWAELGVPYVPPVPVFGNVLQLTRFNTSIFLKRIHRRYAAPYVGIWYMWRPALIINSPEIAHRILVKDSINFRERYVRPSENDVIGSNILFCLKEPLWSGMRRRADAVFTSPKTKRLYETKQSKAIHDLVFRLKREMTENNHVNLKEVFGDYAADVVGAAVVGGEATRRGDGALRALMLQLVDFDMSRKLTWIISFFYPALKDSFLYRRPAAFPPRVAAALGRMYRAAAKRRDEQDAAATRQEDLVDVLRRLRREGGAGAGAGAEVPEELLVAQCVIFLQAGFDAVANILSYCFFELAYNQSAQDKLYEEISHVKCRNEEGFMDVADVLDLKYLKSVVNETLRKYSQLGWLDRVASKSYRVDEKLTIPAGTPVLINSIGMRYDPALFPEPEKFLPERFLCDEGARSASASLPFGEGPRACIGKRLSAIILRHTVASVVREFRVRSLPGSAAPSEATITNHSLFYVPGKPLLVQFERRLQ